jgi:anti-anti-sigma factor
MSEFNAVARRRNGTAVIDLTGDLDGSAGPTLNAAWEKASADAPLALLLNFADVGYINSTGIALIVGILAQARQRAISVRVCGLTDHYKHIFEITRLADFMSFFPDEESAVGDGMQAPA